MAGGPEARGSPTPAARDALAVAFRSIGPRGVLAVLRRPWLWPAALRVGAQLAPDRWWARPPHLPVPAPAYLQFRMVTAYGGDGTTPMPPSDLVEYLGWVRSWPSSVRDEE